jgi:hypothetical protein
MINIYVINIDRSLKYIPYVNLNLGLQHPSQSYSIFIDFIVEKRKIFSIARYEIISIELI